MTSKEAVSTLSVPDIHPDLQIAHSGLDVGNMDPRFGDTPDIFASRAELQRSLQLGPEQTAYVLVPQAKTDIVDVDTDADERITSSQEYREIDVIADALVTTNRATSLMLNTADCIPLTVFEPKNNILALVHIGWRGAVAGFPQEVVDYLNDKHGFDIENSLAYLGPSIQQGSYKSESLHEAQVDNPDWEPHIKDYEDGFYIDIPGFLISCLVKSGMNPQNVHQSMVDTGHPDSGHFSFTRHKQQGVPNGRNGFVAAIS